MCSFSRLSLCFFWNIVQKVTWRAAFPVLDHTGAKECEFPSSSTWEFPGNQGMHQLKLLCQEKNLCRKKWLLWCRNWGHNRMEDGQQIRGLRYHIPGQAQRSPVSKNCWNCEIEQWDCSSLLRSSRIIRYLMTMAPQDRNKTKARHKITGQSCRHAVIQTQRQQTIAWNAEIRQWTAKIEQVT